MTAACTVVLAGAYPKRDAFVDALARASLGRSVDITDETYQGLWRLPTPEHTLVHLFTEPADVEVLRAYGYEQATNACEGADKCMFDRMCSTIRVDHA